MKSLTPSQERFYTVWKTATSYAMWQGTHFMFAMGIAAASLSDDLATETVPLLRWRALVLFMLAYSAIFSLIWFTAVVRMVHPDDFKTYWTTRLTATEQKNLVKDPSLDKDSATRAVAMSVWRRTALITSVQVIYYSTMTLMYGIAAMYIVFVYKYTDDSAVPSIQTAIDKGYSKGPEFMSFAVHKKISMLVWLQHAFVFSFFSGLIAIVLSLYTRPGLDKEQKPIQNSVDTYNKRTFYDINVPPEPIKRTGSTYSRQNSVSRRPMVSSELLPSDAQ